MRTEPAALVPPHTDWLGRWAVRPLPWWLALLPAALLLLWGYLRLRSGAAVSGSGYGLFATERLAWSDIISIYGRDNMQGHPFPYSAAHSFEYPVLTGLVFYLAGFADSGRDLLPAFTANYLVLGLAALGLLALTARRAGANPWLLALSPAVVLYTGANWDMLALLPGIAALLLYEQDRDLPATLLLALSVWLKFFAILWLPLVLVERLRRGRWPACARIVAVFVALSLAINLPFALRDRDGWGLFFTFNRERSIEVNLWTYWRDNLSIDTVNTLSLLGLALAVAVLAVAQWRSGRDITLPAAAILLTWFFFLNKVYSPQYFIWLLPFLALLDVPLWLYLLLTFVDVIYYVASFQILHISFVQNGPATLSDWDYNHVLLPAMALREAAFVALILWVAVCYPWRHARVPAGAETRRVNAHASGPADTA